MGNQRNLTSGLAGLAGLAAMHLELLGAQRGEHWHS